MKRIFAAALVAGLGFATAEAELININFEQFTPSPPYAFEDPATMEGPAGGLGTTWNQYDDDDSSGIVLDSGNNPTTVTVTTNFSEGRPGSGSNLTVFRDSLTDFGRGQNRTVTISGLAADSLYDVWILAYRDSTSAKERLGGYWTSVNPTSSVSTRILSSYSVRNGTTFQENVNFLHYKDVLSDGSGDIVFTGKGGEATDPDFSEDIRLGLSGLQILAVPEPSSLALLGLGGLLMLRRSSAQVARRRRG